MSKSARCHSDSKPNLYAAGLLVLVFATMLVAALVLGPRLDSVRLVTFALVALALMGLLEVLRSYWTDRHGAGTAAGTLRELVLWFGLWVLLYGVYSPSESESGIAALPLAPNRAGEEYSLVIAVLGFVLALTTLIATKVAADARSEVQAVRDELHAAKDVAFLAESASFDLSLQRLMAWRVEIRFTLDQCAQNDAASLVGLDKVVKALKVPLESVHKWGSSALDVQHLTDHARQASALLSATEDPALAVAKLLGNSRGENHLRKLGAALAQFLDVLRARHPHATVTEDRAWEALARLSRQLQG